MTGTIDSRHLEAEPERVVTAAVAEAGEPAEDLPHVHRAVAVVVEQVEHARRQRDQRLQLHRLQHLLELHQRRVLAIRTSTLGTAYQVFFFFSVKRFQN